MVIKYIILSLLVLSCSSDYEVKNIETELEVKDSIDGSQIGINDDNEVIIQTETSVADELRSQKWVNSKLEDELNNEYSELKHCREDLADPRLGGSGGVTEIPEIDDLKQATEVREEIGLAEDGKLKVVKKKYFLEDLKKERKYEKTLKSMLKVVKKHGVSCSRKMGIARHKSGLPANRYQSKGYFTEDGTWVSTQKAENNLDDAFERAAKSKQKNKSNN